MPSPLFSSSENQTPTERRAGIVNQIVIFAGLLQSGGWFIALSKLLKNVHTFFMRYQQFFFVATILLSFINCLAYLIKFSHAANKNAGKLTKLAYFCFNLMLCFGIALTVILASLSFASTLYYLSCIVDPLLNVGKAIYFMAKFFLANNHAEKKFFYHKAITAAKFAIFTGLLVMGMITLYAVPGLPLLLTAALGVIGVAMVLTPILYTAWTAISRRLKKPSPANDILEEIEERSSVLQINQALQTSRTGFYSESVLGNAANKHELKTQIINLNKDIREQEKTESKWKQFIWPEKVKRDNKRSALSFLMKMLEAKPQFSASGKASLSVEGKQFAYNNKEDLIKQLDQYVLKRYTGVYQSFFKDKGRVNACFNRAYQLIRSSQP